MRVRTFALFALLLGTLNLIADVRVGQAAPDFAATDVNGRTHRLADYRGKIVVIEAYSPACPYSLNQYKSGAMPALQGNVVPKGVVWLTVNSNGPGSPGHRTAEVARKDFGEAGGKATGLIDDSNGALGRKYGLKTTPQIVVIDQQGVVAYTGAVDDRAATTGDPRTARSYVRQAIESLIAGKPSPVAETAPYGTPIKYAP